MAAEPVPAAPAAVTSSVQLSPVALTSISPFMAVSLAPSPTSAFMVCWNTPTFTVAPTAAVAVPPVAVRRSTICLAFPSARIRISFMEAVSMAFLPTSAKVLLPEINTLSVPATLAPEPVEPEADARISISVSSVEALTSISPAVSLVPSPMTALTLLPVMITDMVPPTAAPLPPAFTAREAEICVSLAIFSALISAFFVAVITAFLPIPALTVFPVSMTFRLPPMEAPLCPDVETLAAAVTAQVSVAAWALTFMPPPILKVPPSPMEAITSSPSEIAAIFSPTPAAPLVKVSAPPISLVFVSEDAATFKSPLRFSVTLLPISACVLLLKKSMAAAPDTAALGGWLPTAMLPAMDSI